MFIDNCDTRTLRCDNFFTADQYQVLIRLPDLRGRCLGALPSLPQGANYGPICSRREKLKGRKSPPHGDPKRHRNQCDGECQVGPSIERPLTAPVPGPSTAKGKQVGNWPFEPVRSAGPHQIFHQMQMETDQGEDCRSPSATRQKKCREKNYDRERQGMQVMVISGKPQ